MYAKTFPYFSREYALANYLNTKLDEDYYRQIEEKQLQEEIFYTEWLNSKFINANFQYRINKLCDDLRNGNLLIKIIEVLDNVALSSQKKNTILSIKTRLHNIANIDKCLNYLKNVRKFNINMKPDDIANGDRKKILSLLFLLKHFYEKPQRHSSVNNQLDASFFSKLSGISDTSQISSSCSDDPFNKSVSNEKETDLVEKRNSSNQGIKVELINENKEIICNEVQEPTAESLIANKSTSNEKQKEFVEIKNVCNQDPQTETSEDNKIEFFDAKQLNSNANEPTKNDKQEDSNEIKDVCNQDINYDTTSNEKEDDFVQERDVSNQVVSVETIENQEYTINDVKKETKNDDLLNGFNKDIDPGYEIHNKLEKDHEGSGGLNGKINGEINNNNDTNEMSNTKDLFNITKIEHETSEVVVTKPFDNHDETDIKQMIIENRTQPDEEQVYFEEEEEVKTFEVAEENCVEIDKIEQYTSVPVQTSVNNFNNYEDESNKEIEEKPQDTYCKKEITFETNEVNSVVHELENNKNNTSLNKQYANTSESLLTIPLKSNEYNEPIEISENEAEDDTNIQVNRHNGDGIETQVFSNECVCQNEDQNTLINTTENNEIGTINKEVSHQIEKIKTENTNDSIKPPEINAIQHQNNNVVKSNSTFIEQTSKEIVNNFDKGNSDTSIHHKNSTEPSSQEIVQNKQQIENKTNGHDLKYKKNKSETSIHQNGKKKLQETNVNKPALEDKTNSHDVTSYNEIKADIIPVQNTTKTESKSAINKCDSKTRVQENVNSNDIIPTTTNARENTLPNTIENNNDKELYSKIIKNSSKIGFVKSSEDLRVKTSKVDVKTKTPDVVTFFSNSNISVKRVDENPCKNIEKSNDNNTKSNNNSMKHIKKKDSKTKSAESKMNGDGEPNNKQSLYGNDDDKARLNLIRQKIGDCDMSTVDTKTILNEKKTNFRRHFESPTSPRKRKQDKTNNNKTKETIIKSYSSNNMEILGDKVNESKDTNLSPIKSANNTLIKQALKTSLISFILISSVGFMYLVFKNLEKKL